MDGATQLRRYKSFFYFLILWFPLGMDSSWWSRTELTSSAKYNFIFESVNNIFLIFTECIKHPSASLCATAHQGLQLSETKTRELSASSLNLDKLGHLQRFVQFQFGQLDRYFFSFLFNKIKCPYRVYII